jgi:hypothetical protein
MATRPPQSQSMRVIGTTTSSSSRTRSRVYLRRRRECSVHTSATNAASLDCGTREKTRCMRSRSCDHWVYCQSQMAANNALLPMLSDCSDVARRTAIRGQALGRGIWRKKSQMIMMPFVRSRRTLILQCIRTEVGWRRVSIEIPGEPAYAH